MAQSITNSVMITCSLEEAFDYLSDHRAELEWNPKCQSMEKLTDGPVGLGTTYRAKWKGSPYVELKTVAYDRPHTWTMHNGGPIEVTLVCRLSAVPGGTRLDASFTPTPHGWFRLVFPMFLVAIRRQEKASMRHLRDALERRAQTGSLPARTDAEKSAGAKTGTIYHRAAGALAWAAGLGFGPLGVYGTVYFAQHHEVWQFMGFPTYGEGPFETIGMTTSLPLLIGFVAVCAAEVVVGWMLWAGRPRARLVSFALLPLEATYWIGFALPFGPVFGLLRTAAVAASMRAASKP